jgi:hypothetical protein
VPTFLRRLSTGSWMCFSISSNHMSQTGLVLNSYSWLPSSWLFFSIRSHYPATSSHRTFKSFPMSLSPPSIYALNAHTARLSLALKNTDPWKITPIHPSRPMTNYWKYSCKFQKHSWFSTSCSISWSPQCSTVIQRRLYAHICGPPTRP